MVFYITCVGIGVIIMSEIVYDENWGKCDSCNEQAVTKITYSDGKIERYCRLHEEEENKK